MIASPDRAVGTHPHVVVVQVGLPPVSVLPARIGPASVNRYLNGMLVVRQFLVSQRVDTLSLVGGLREYRAL
jgi:hypothetical protein